MTTETILTDFQLIEICQKYGPLENMDLSRAIEQAVLQSPEVHALRKDAARYRWLRINAIGAFRTNDGKGPVSVYHLSKIPAIAGIPEETDIAIDAAMEKSND